MRPILKVPVLTLNNRKSYIRPSFTYYDRERYYTGPTFSNGGDERMSYSIRCDLNARINGKNYHATSEVSLVIEIVEEEIPYLPLQEPLSDDITYNRCHDLIFHPVLGGVVVPMVKPHQGRMDEKELYEEALRDIMSQTRLCWWRNDGINNTSYVIEQDPKWGPQCFSLDETGKKVDEAWDNKYSAYDPSWYTPDGRWADSQYEYLARDHG